MPFSIQHLQQKGLGITEMINSDNSSRIQILPKFGALWYGWIIRGNEEEQNLIDHYEDDYSLQRGLAASFKGAKLSPFVCDIAEGKYSFNGKIYKFRSGSAVHGLLYNQPFKQEEVILDDDRASVSFYYTYRKNDPGYPFYYDCTVTYTLYADNKVMIETKILNTGRFTLPLVDGWHPYFTTGNKIDDCYLMFSADRQIEEFAEKPVPTGRLLAYDAFSKERRIGDMKLDSSFLLNKKAVQPKCVFMDRDKKIKLHIYPSDSYPFILLYIPPDRKSIAIEPHSGAPDAFNNGIGLTQLQSHEEKVFSVTYEAIIG